MLLNFHNMCTLLSFVILVFGLETLYWKHLDTRFLILFCHVSKNPRSIRSQILISFLLQDNLGPKFYLVTFRCPKNSCPEVFLEKGVLNIYKVFIQITLLHGCSPVNLLHIFRASSPKNTSGRLLLGVPKNKDQEESLNSGCLLLEIKWETGNEWINSHRGGPYHIKTSALICKVNEWTGFYIYDRDLRHERVKDFCS